MGDTCVGELGSPHDKHMTESALSVSESGTDADNHDGLPNGFPRLLNTELAWCGRKIAKRPSYIYYLTEDDRREIDLALASFYGHGLDSDCITSDTFPLPQFKHVLENIAQIVHEGIGFFVIRGLQTINYKVEDSTTIFLGIQSYIAEKRARQDENGNMIVHITPDPIAAPNPMRKFHVRYSTASVPFHTDLDADILAFHTRATASHGGKCILSSAHTIYNELAQTRPDVIRTLAEPNWPFALPHFHLRPLLFHHASRIILHYTRGGLLGTQSHPRPSTVPTITPRQREALDLIDAIAERHRLEIELAQGDVHFVNNLALVHRRDAFVDVSDEEEGRGVRVQGRRHLVRMHLRSERWGWSIPLELRGFWREAFEDDEEEDEGGVGEAVVGEGKRNMATRRRRRRRRRQWHVDPMIEPYFPLVMMADA